MSQNLAQNALSPAPPKAQAAPSGGRIPSLDGLRGISILLVLFAHLLGTQGFLSVKVAHTIGDLGNLGVRVFFIISGFLITSLLFHEVKKTGTISIKGFYIRRTFRIFPAFYAYLAIIVTLGALKVIPLTDADAIHAATYTVNYAHNRSWYIGHTWSLSVEEQFYLLWPAALLLIPGAGAATGVPIAEQKRRIALWASIAVILLAPFARIGTWMLLPEQRDLIGEAFPTIADSIAFGCLLAALRNNVGEHPLYLRFLRSPWFILVPVAAFVVNRFAIYVRPFYVAGETLLDLMIAMTIDRAVRFPDGLSGRILNAKPLTSIGVWSYSIYLWQQPFLNRNGPFAVQRFPLNLICAFGAAMISYYLVERPVLELRVRLDKRGKHAS